MNFTEAMNYAKNRDVVIQRSEWSEDDCWIDKDYLEIHGVYWDESGSFILMDPSMDGYEEYIPTKEDMEANDWNLI